MLITFSYALLYGDSLKITYKLIEDIMKLQKAPSNEARCTDATVCATCYRKQEKGTQPQGGKEKRHSRYGQRRARELQRTQEPQNEKDVIDHSKQ